MKELHLAKQAATRYGEHPERIGNDVDTTLCRFLIASITEYAVFALSPQGRIISWNSGAQRAFGYSESEVIDRPFGLIFTPEDAAAGLPEQELSEALNGHHVTHGRWHLRQDGSRFWGNNTIQSMRASNGELIGFAKLVRDNTEELRTLEAVSDSEQQLRLLIESVSEYAIASVGIDGRITSWNSGAQQLFGYREFNVVGKELGILFLTADRQFSIQQLQTAASAGSASYEGWVVRQDGTQFFVSSKLSRINGGLHDQARGYVLVAHDVTERHFAAAGLQHRAFHDSLTNIPNRAAFYEHVARAIASRKRHPSHVFAVLYVDLDNFKVINDVFGHNGADTLLQYTAQRLAASVRDDDVIARIAGDEFAVLLNGVDGPSEAHEIADRITAAMARPLSVGGHDAKVTASVGIAMCNDKHTKPEDILHDADVAMYVAKERGRAGSVRYAPAMRARRQLTLEGDLRDALASDQLRVHYQPIFALANRRLVGFEALVRWQHPQRGLLEPLEFLAVAEAANLIIAIDRWVLRRACAQIKEWLAEPGAPHGMYVSVNLSPKQFSQPDLLDELRTLLVTTGVRAESVHLEITESAFMERSERTLRMLQEIAKLGIELHVDDFGTGYSSLAALQHMPVQGLKIDSQFVTSMGSHSGYEIVRSIATLAHHLGLTATAEGIRTEEHMRELEGFGCQFGQGFLLSPPLEAQAATRYFTTQQWHAQP